MVERRIERAHEKEKSVLYKNQTSLPTSAAAVPPPPPPVDDAMSQTEMANIESQLSPEQLQLFAEENDLMLRHYEDTLGKVQYVSTLFSSSSSSFPNLTVIFY